MKKESQQEYAVHEFDWLVSFGVPAEEAAQRVGVSVQTIDRYRYRINDKHREDAA